MRCWRAGEQGLRRARAWAGQHLERVALQHDLELLQQVERRLRGAYVFERGVDEALACSRTPSVACGCMNNDKALRPCQLG